MPILTKQPWTIFPKWGKWHQRSSLLRDNRALSSSSGFEIVTTLFEGLGLRLRLEAEEEEDDEEEEDEERRRTGERDCLRPSLSSSSSELSEE